MDAILSPIEDAIGWLLQFLYQLPPHNLGVAIILMTAVVMALMLPLTAKQVRSTVAMQKLAPEIKKIQAEYKEDRQKQSEEVMKFYKENDINPLSGCLPLIVQLPVWVALYRTLQAIPKHISKSSDLFVKLCGDAQYYATTKSAGIAEAQRKVADAVKAGKDKPTIELAKKALASAQNIDHQGVCLKKPAHTLEFLGMDLRLKLSSAAKLADASFWSLLPYGLLVAFVVATGVIQTRQTMARQKKQNPDQPVNPQMQMMMKVMPFMNLMTAFFPVGVALYWGARNVWMIGQQHFVLAKFYGEAPASSSKAGAKTIDATSTEVSRSGPKTNPNTSKKKQQRRKR